MYTFRSIIVSGTLIQRRNIVLTSKAEQTSRSLGQVSLSNLMSDSLTLQGECLWCRFWKAVIHLFICLQRFRDFLATYLATGIQLTNRKSWNIFNSFFDWLSKHLLLRRIFAHRSLNFWQKFGGLRVTEGMTIRVFPGLDLVALKVLMERVL